LANKRRKLVRTPVNVNYRPTVGKPSRGHLGRGLFAITMR